MVEGGTELKCAGLTARLEANVPAMALRYFSSDGALASAARAAGAPLPPSQRAQSGTGDLVLAWRSPSETLSLARGAQRLAELQHALVNVSDGCCVELTGALSVIHLSGERIADIIARLGGSALLPPLGGAHRGRMADVPVLSICLRRGQLLLVIERFYAEHLWSWIRETLLDFA